MNVSLSALERLLHRYTMEPTIKAFDVRSVPVEAVHVEQPKGLNFHPTHFLYLMKMVSFCV